MKPHLNLSIPPNGRIAVVGDIHEHPEQFEKLLTILKPSDKLFLASVGDLYDKGFGTAAAESIVDLIHSLNQRGVGFVVKGNHELKQIKRAKIENNLTPQLIWLEQQPLVLSFLFENGSRVTVLHGGVKPSHEWDDLDLDIETSYIRDLDDKLKPIKVKWIDGEAVPLKPGGRTWHHFYDGRFGYIASGHEPCRDGRPRFYNYSVNLDTACYLTGILTCQIFSEYGCEDLIQIPGPAGMKQSMAC